jgi:uncharacterized membrane protein YraQ (UPF0718 family)
MKAINIKNSLLKTGRSFKNLLPIILGVLLLLSLLITIIPKEFYSKIFTGNMILDSFFGTVAGSISAGNPLISYIVGGELLDQGVSLVAVTAFILSWISVGIIQLPAEVASLGKKFALIRNFFSFITAIIIAILTVFTISLL